MVAMVSLFPRHCGHSSWTEDWVANLKANFETIPIIRILMKISAFFFASSFFQKEFLVKQY